MDPVETVLDTVAPRTVNKTVVIAAGATVLVVAGVVAYRKFAKRNGEVVESEVVLESE